MLIVLSGPSGAGKTTIMHGLRDHFDAVFSVSATTRPATAEERDGVDYYFIDESKFKQMLADGQFLEHAMVFGRYYYGTPRGPVEDHLETGRIVILDIDVQGAEQINRAMPEAFMIFVLPPSEEELLRRLRERGRDDEAAIQRRFAEAQREISFARSSAVFDAFLVNDVREQAIGRAVELVEGYRVKESGRESAAS